MIEFSDFIVLGGFVGVSFIGNRFTWFDPSNWYSRLDRLLVWGIKQLNFSREISDHSPLLLVFSEVVLKFNVDGSGEAKSGLLNCGGVQCDWNSKILALFSGPFRILGSCEAELHVVHQVLTLMVVSC
ncbi:hypothetical protein V6N12_067721 [Hibiscus sabdariffa]|uniref:Uncharacterized protein n=1 Tax=Hibiscus sabdariffa TaxID=183260 RepID=A0ABR2FNJ7_9ROSI